MTVVVACWFLKSVAVIADCRVSYVPTGVVDDNLQKIYQIGERAVLGFSGPLPGAYQVVELVRRNMRGYSKRPVASNLRMDVERWIRYEYRKIRPPENRKNLGFLLATVEPRRKARSRWVTPEGKERPEPRGFPWRPEFHMLVLKPSQSRPGELVKEEKGLIKILGIRDEEHCSAIEGAVQSLYDMASRYPREGARMVANALQSVLMKRQVPWVGGLFQCALLSAKGIEWLGHGFGDVALDFANGRYVQRNTSTGRAVPLRAIWEWWEGLQASRLGGVGAFEDPDLRRAVDKALQAEEENGDD